VDVGAGSLGVSSPLKCDWVVGEIDSHIDSSSCAEAALALDRPLVEVAIPFADFLSFFELNRPKSGIGRLEQELGNSRVRKGTVVFHSQPQK
jgi:hypothetical protein